MCDYENKAKEIVEKYVPEKVWLGYIDREDSLDEGIVCERERDGK